VAPCTRLPPLPATPAAPAISTVEGGTDITARLPEEGCAPGSAKEWAGTGLPRARAVAEAEASVPVTPVPSDRQSLRTSHPSAPTTLPNRADTGGHPLKGQRDHPHAPTARPSPSGPSRDGGRSSRRSRPGAARDRLHARDPRVGDPAPEGRQASVKHPWPEPDTPGSPSGPEPPEADRHTGPGTPADEPPHTFDRLRHGARARAGDRQRNRPCGDQGAGQRPRQHGHRGLRTGQRGTDDAPPTQGHDSRVSGSRSPVTSHDWFSPPTRSRELPHRQIPPGVFDALFGSPYSRRRDTPRGN
jgi:hypothetical protein